jgi:hypothetical protein
LLVVLLIMASTIEVAFAEPPGPVPASCHMVASWWPPDLDPDTGETEDTGPGNAKGVQPGHRGMYYVHDDSRPSGETNGALNMEIICPG